MAFLAPKTDTPNANQGPQPYEIDGPLPVVFGRQIVAAKLIESPFNHVVLDHGDRRPKGNVYSLAVAVCWGPVERLFSIRINGKPVYPVNAAQTGSWSIATSRNGQNFTDLTYWSQADGIYRNTGRVRIYWGTDTQDPDPLLNGQSRTLTPNAPRPGAKNPNGSNRVHPPYTGICYLVFDTIHFDDEPGAGIRGSSTVPVIEADVFVPPPGDVFAGSGEDRWERGSNPIAVTREKLRNPIWGAALPSHMLPESAWTAAAQDYFDTGFHYQTGTEAYLSPIWPQTQELGNLLGDFFQYFNGFLKIQNGQILPGYIPAITQDPGAITELSRHDCLEEPDIDPQGWEDAYTEVELTAKNVYERHNEEKITVRSPYVRRLVGEERRKTVDAPFVIHPASATAMATRTLRSIGQPSMRIAAKIMTSRAINPDGTLIMPGDLVHFDYEPHQLDLLCRVIEREDKRGEVRLVMDSEPGRYPQDYVEVVDNRQRPEMQEPAIVANFRIIELPDDLTTRTWPPTVAVIAQRPNSSIIGAETWISANGDFTGEEQLLEDPLTVWATRVIIEDFIGADATEVLFSIDTTSGVPSESLFRSFTAAEQKDGEMLLLVDQELISLGAFSVDGSVYTMGALRSMWGTPRANNVSTGATAWLIRKSDLLRIATSHELLRWTPPYSAAAARAWFRLRTYTAFAVDEQVSSTQFVQLRDRTPAAPTNLNVAINGMEYIIWWTNPAAHYATTIVQVIQPGGGVAREIAGATVTVRGSLALTTATVRVRSVGPNGTQSAWTTYPLQVRNGVDFNIATSATQTIYDSGDGSAVTSAPVIRTRKPAIDAILRMRVSIDGRAMFTDSGTVDLVAYLATKRTGTTTWTVWDGNAGRPLAVVLQQQLSSGVTKEFLFESYFAHNTAAVMLLGDPLIDWAVHVPASASVSYAITARMQGQQDTQIEMPPIGPQLQ